jgi:hypothetical protein
MHRCCICRCPQSADFLEPTGIPGADVRCINRDRCRRRVHGIVTSAQLATILKQTG